MIPPVDRETLLAAMQRFDAELRTLPEWQGWEDKRSHLYAIEHEGKRYPVKQIISMATGEPVSEFSGGKSGGQANRYAEERLFAVVPLRSRNPPWTRDELILALDLYLTHRHSLPAHESRGITDLSAILGKLAAKLGLSGDATYRNRNGIYMKLMNFRALDPEFTRQGKQGLRSTGRGDREVWREFSSDPKRCHEAAQAIRAAITSAELDVATAADDPDEEFAEAEEGRLLTRLHRHRERNRKLVEAKKQRALKQHGALRCEACSFDFGKRYGMRGQGFIECHHTRPVHELSEGHKTRLTDLALVCANCHRIIHVRRPWLSIEQLRAMVGSPHPQL